MVKKAVGYIRVSTERQADKGVSLDAQRARIVAWCEFNGYELTAVHIDAGISGKTMKNRAGVQDALVSVRKGMALVVYSLSRLARSTKDALQISETLNQKGADLVSLTEQIDTTSAAGKMIFSMMAAFSQFERDLASERTRAALSYKKANGEKYAPVPFGFEEMNGRLVEVQEETEIVADILGMRSRGVALSRIAGELNGRGVSGKNGGKWYASTVRYLIQRQAA